MLAIVKTPRSEYRVLKDFGATKDGGKTYNIFSKNNVEYDLQVWKKFARITSRKNHKIVWEGDSQKLKWFKKVEQI